MHGSPRNPFGSHCSYKFKDGQDGYKRAWRLHASQINGGATTAKACGPIRGTIRRVAMIAAAMKDKCVLVDSESIDARSGPKSPLEGSFPEKPSDYGLKRWLDPAEEGVDPKTATGFTCSDLNVIKRAMVAEDKRRIQDRDKETRSRSFSEADTDEIGMGLEALLAAKAGDFTEEMIDALAQVHTELHREFKATEDEAERPAIAEQHEQVVRKWLSLSRRHAMQDGLDEALPEDLIEASESTIDDMMDEYNDLHRKGRNMGIFPALQEQYDELKEEMEQAGITVGWFDELDGDKAEHYQTRAIEQDIKDSVGKIEEGTKGKYSLQVAADGEQYTCTMKLGVGGKVARWLLFVPKKLRSKDEDAKAALKESGENILTALLDGKTFRGQYEAELGPKSELDRPKGEVQGNETDGYMLTVDSGQYEAAYSFEDDKHSARYELSGGELKDHALVVRGIEMEGSDERVWTFALVESEAEKASRDIERRAVNDWVNAAITKSYEGDDGERYIEYAITTTTRIDHHGTRPTLQFMLDNVKSYPVPLLFGHVVDRPENTLGKVIERELIGDDVLWSKARVSKAEPTTWQKVLDGTYDGVSMGVVEPEYSWDPANPGCALFTAGIIIEDSLTALQSNEDARIGVAYEELRAKVTRLRAATEKEENSMDAEVQRAVDEATHTFGEKLRAGLTRVFGSTAKRDVSKGQDEKDEKKPAAGEAESQRTDAAAATREAAVTAPEEPTPEDMIKSQIEWAVVDVVRMKLEPLLKDIVAEALASIMQLVTDRLDKQLTADTTTRSRETKEVKDALDGLKKQVNDALGGMEERVAEVAGTETVTRSRDAGEAAPPKPKTDIERRREIWAKGSIPPLRK